MSTNRRKRSPKNFMFQWLGDACRIDPIRRRKYYQVAKVNGTRFCQGDFVHLLSGIESSLPYLARIDEMWESYETGETKFKCRWFYRPSDCMGLIPGRQLEPTIDLPNELKSKPNEVFFTEHADENTFESLCERVTVRFGGPVGGCVEITKDGSPEYYCRFSYNAYKKCRNGMGKFTSLTPSVINKLRPSAALYEVVKKGKPKHQIRTEKNCLVRAPPSVHSASSGTSSGAALKSSNTSNRSHSPPSAKVYDEFGDIDASWRTRPKIGERHQVSELPEPKKVQEETVQNLPSSDNVVENLVEILKKWTREERDSFAVQLHKHGLDFKKVASSLANKSRSDVVEYYYLMKINDSGKKSLLKDKQNEENECDSSACYYCQSKTKIVAECSMSTCAVRACKSCVGYRLHLKLDKIKEKGFWLCPSCQHVHAGAKKPNFFTRSKRKKRELACQNGAKKPKLSVIVKKTQSGIGKPPVSVRVPPTSSPGYKQKKQAKCFLDSLWYACRGVQTNTYYSTLNNLARFNSKEISSEELIVRVAKLLHHDKDLLEAFSRFVPKYLQEKYYSIASNFTTSTPVSSTLVE